LGRRSCEFGYQRLNFILDVEVKPPGEFAFGQSALANQSRESAASASQSLYGDGPCDPVEFEPGRRHVVLLPGRIKTKRPARHRRINLPRARRPSSGLSRVPNPCRGKRRVVA
jgi:hypothetical protein